MDVWMDGWTSGRVDGMTDGRMDNTAVDMDRLTDKMKILLSKAVA